MTKQIKISEVKEEQQQRGGGGEQEPCERERVEGRYKY